MPARLRESSVYEPRTRTEELFIRRLVAERRAVSIAANFDHDYSRADLTGALFSDPVVFNFIKALSSLRMQGARYLSTLSQELCDLASGGDPLWKRRGFMELDAQTQGTHGPKTVAKILLPYDALKGESPWSRNIDHGPYLQFERPDMFVNIDNPRARAQIHECVDDIVMNEQYFAYSDFSETIKDGRLQSPEGSPIHYNPIGPVWFVMQEVDHGLMVRRIEGKFIPRFKEQLRQAEQNYKASQKGGKKEPFPYSGILQNIAAISADMRTVLMANFPKNPDDPFKDVFEALRKTRSSTVALEDIARKGLSRGPKLKPLKFLADNSEVGRDLSRRFYEALTETTYEVVMSPRAVVATRVKTDSLPTKVLLAQYHPQLQAGYDSGELNAFLRSRGIAELIRYKERDLHDLFGASYIIFGKGPNEDPKKIRSYVFETTEQLTGMKLASDGSIDIVANNPAMFHYKRLGLYVDPSEVEFHNREDAKVYYYRIHINARMCAGRQKSRDDLYLEAQVSDNEGDTNIVLWADHDVVKQQAQGQLDFLVSTGALHPAVIKANEFLLRDAIRHIIPEPEGVLLSGQNSAAFRP